MATDSPLEAVTTCLQALIDSLMYRLTYYRFAEASLMTTGKLGFDRVRNTEIGLKDFKLKYFEEVFTTEHWMVRIYKVRDRCASKAAGPNPPLPSSILGTVCSQLNAELATVSVLDPTL